MKNETFVWKPGETRRVRILPPESDRALVICEGEVPLDIAEELVAAQNALPVAFDLLAEGLRERDKVAEEPCYCYEFSSEVRPACWPCKAREFLARHGREVRWQRV